MPDPFSSLGRLVMSKTSNVTRRDFLRSGLAAGAALASTAPMFSLLGCERHRYVRPAGLLDLGPVSELLYTKAHVRSKAVMVFRDADGWRALSTRCTYIGCDLTPQDMTHEKPVLFCPCCRSYYDEFGRVFKDMYATIDLPWCQMSYKDGHLFADPGKIVDIQTHFTTAEIEEAVHALRQRYKEESISDEVHIPQFLQGNGDGEPGKMFTEEDPNMIHELDMIR